MYTENDPVAPEDEDVEDSQPEYGQDKGMGCGQIPSDQSTLLFN